jgi:hypothetical protein
MTDDKIVRDIEAAELILKHPRILELYNVPQCGATPAQLRAAVQLAESLGRIGVLVCEDCQPDDKYVVVRVVDVPLLVSLIYQKLSQ